MKLPVPLLHVIQILNIHPMGVVEGHTHALPTLQHMLTVLQHADLSQAISLMAPVILIIVTLFLYHLEAPVRQHADMLGATSLTMVLVEK